MSLLNHIEKLRRRPESHRQRIAVIYAFLITAILAVVWLSLVFYGPI